MARNALKSPLPPTTPRLLVGSLTPRRPFGIMAKAPFTGPVHGEGSSYVTLVTLRTKLQRYMMIASTPCQLTHAKLPTRLQEAGTLYHLLSTVLSQHPADGHAALLPIRSRMTTKRQTKYPRYPDFGDLDRRHPEGFLLTWVGRVCYLSVQVDIKYIES